MTKREGPGKDASQPSENPGSKRPHATLDLKATEIRANETKDSGSASASGAATAQSAAGTAKDAKPATASASQPTAGAAAAASAAPASASASASKPANESSAPKPGASAKPETGRQGASAATGTGRPPQPQRPTASGGAFTRFVSHVVSGVAGGLLTFAGLSAIQPQQNETAEIAALSDVTESLRQRLDKLSETAETQQSSAAGLSRKLTEAESRFAKLDKMDQSIGALSDSLAKVASDQAAISEKLNAATADGGPTARIAKLEDQLATIAASASNAPEGSQIPQLAAITGKVSDLESTIASQTDTLRKDLLQELGKQTGEVREQSEAARSATARLDRDLAQLKTDAARLSQQFEVARANSDRVDDQIRTLREAATNLSTTVDGLKNDIEARFKTTAGPADIAAAIAPLTGRIASLEGDVKAVVTGEDNRKANAERIVLSLELANLKRLLEAGRGYASELAEVKKAAGAKVDLAALEPFKDEGVPTIPELAREFRPVANAVIDSATEPSEGSIVDRLLAGAKSVVRVRKVSHDASDQSVEAVLGRMETALKDERLADVLSEAKKLPPAAARPAEDWIAKVEARASVDRAVADIERQLKASLTGAEASSPNGAGQ
jgi:hypothetical protein